MLYVLLTCISTYCRAVPARQSAFSVRQSDGDVLTLRLMGDESFHYLATEEGMPVIEEDGSYYYANIIDSQLTSSGIMVHGTHRRTIQELCWIEKKATTCMSAFSREWENRRARRQGFREVIPNGRRTRGTGERNRYVGKKRGLVLLVNFSDKSMWSATASHDFYNMFNQIGYSVNNSMGSVHDYFYAQSYGMFDLSFDVIGPLTLSHAMRYYGSNDSYGDDKYAATMVAEACNLADASVDFSDYDWDGDGVVDQVYVIYAGYGEHAGAPSYTIWPHEYSLSAASKYGDGQGAIYLDGMKIDRYATSCELRGASGLVMDGIGTACHEFSHCLGLNDVYDTSYSGGFGMGHWDLMDAGSFNGITGHGECPAGYTAYERWVAGWLDFTELSEPCEIENMEPLNDKPMAYVIRNDAYPDEFFVLENHACRDWYSYVNKYAGISHGLIIYHIDYDEKAWSNNTINKIATHQRLSIVTADNDYGFYVMSSGIYSPSQAEYAGDPFPGSHRNTALTPTTHTHVGGKYFQRNSEWSYLLNWELRFIEEKNDGTISFRYEKIPQTASR